MAKIESKRENIITKSVLRDAETQRADGVKLECANGESLELFFHQLSHDLQWEAMAHGLSQKLGDAAAISRNPETGRSASVEDKWTAVMEVYSRLLGGEWNAQREGGGGGSLLLRALVKFYDGRRSAEDVREWLKSKSKDEQAALRKNPKIAAIIIELQAAGASEVDTDAMLDELGE